MSPLSLFCALLLASDVPPAVVATQPLSPITGAALSRDGRFAAVTLDDAAVVVWDTTAGKPTQTLAGHAKAILATAFSPDGKFLLLGSADGIATLWDIATGQRLQTFRGHAGSVQAVAFGPDGTRVLTGSADATATVSDARTGSPIFTAKGHRKELMAVAFAPDGKTFATASADTTAAVWDATTGTQLQLLRGHGEGVSCVAFSADGLRVATGSWENHGIVWDAATGKQLMKTARHNNDVYAVGLSPDGRRILTGDREAAVMMWDAATGEKLRTFLGHTGDIVALAVGTDGRVMLTASRDGTAKLWDLTTGRELLTLTTDAARKSWAAVSPAGFFDASAAGRHALGFRFANGTTAAADQFFADGYRPGLLAEVVRGERPVPAKPFGRRPPPRVRIVTPASKVFPTPEATLAVEVADAVGGVSGLSVEVNGVRTVVSADAKSVRVSLAPGTNKVKVRAANADGSWESPAAEVTLTHPKPANHRSRLYIVAVGDDARTLGEQVRTRSGKLFDRVDVLALSDKEATKTVVLDTIQDVAELTRPGDGLAVFLGGGASLEDAAAAIGTAAAQKRMLVADATAPPGMVERLARTHGVHVFAGVAVCRTVRADGFVGGSYSSPAHPFPILSGDSPR